MSEKCIQLDVSDSLTVIDDLILRLGHLLRFLSLRPQGQLLMDVLHLKEIRGEAIKDLPPKAGPESKYSDDFMEIYEAQLQGLVDCLYDMLFSIETSRQILIRKLDLNGSEFQEEELELESEEQLESFYEIVLPQQRAWLVEGTRSFAQDIESQVNEEKNAQLHLLEEWGLAVRESVLEDLISAGPTLLQKAVSYFVNEITALFGNT